MSFSCFPRRVLEAELTHGEANGLVVARGLCLLDRLHERPGILVDLKHQTVRPRCCLLQARAQRPGLLTFTC